MSTDQSPSQQKLAEEETVFKKAGEDVRESMLTLLDNNAGNTVAGKSRRFAAGLPWDSVTVAICLQRFAREGDPEGKVKVQPWTDRQKKTWLVTRLDEGGDPA